MRAGPLSNDKVIETLNRFYVAAYVSQDDYKRNGPASAEERETFNEIALFTRKEKMSCGSVCGYVLAPDGTVLDSGVVSLIIKGDALLNMLQTNAAKLGTKPGKPVVEPHPQFPRPETKRGELALHVVSRAEGTAPGKGGWRAFPGENWVVLTKSDAARLIPSGKINVGTKWELDKAVTDRLLIYFYPQSEDVGDRPDCTIESQSLMAKVESMKNGIALARIEGTLRMQHNFYPGRSGDMVDATIVGYMEFELAKKEIRSLKLVTEKANWGKTKFDVAVRSEPTSEH
jgi:hypothetical protein